MELVYIPVLKLTKCQNLKSKKQPRYKDPGGVLYVIERVVSSSIRIVLGSALGQRSEEVRVWHGRLKDRIHRYNWLLIEHIDRDHILEGAACRLRGHGRPGSHSGSTEAQGARTQR